MTTSRQDAWSNEEDLLLAEVVLRHIREGGTQLAAFEEVGQRLSRTAAACGFRWNSLVRKKYESAISLAKKQRKSTESVVMPPVQETKKVEGLTLDDLIAYLESLRSQEEAMETVRKENESLKNLIVELKNDNEKLVDEIEEIKKEHFTIQSDYKVLIDIMERARKNVAQHAEQK